MSQQNVKIVSGGYEAFGRGDIPSIIAALHPQVEWWEAESFVYADKNPYLGPRAVLEGVFQRIIDEWDGFQVAPKELLDAGDTVTTAALTSGPDGVLRRNSRSSSRFVTTRWRGFSSTPTPRSFKTRFER